LLRLRNSFLCTSGKYLNLHIWRVALGFQVPYISHYITEYFRKQADSIQNQENAIFLTPENVKPNMESSRGLSLAAVKCTTIQMTRLPL
jgi:hypothetical protein